MKRAYTNIYKTCRDHAGLTQEAAAELMFISTRSLSDYETGRTVPPDDIVCAMVENYKTPILAYQHLQRNNPVGQKYLPEIRDEDLSRAVLRFQKEQNDLQLVHPDMVAIACDGEVSVDELHGWSQIKQEVMDVAGAALSLLFRKEERPLTAAR